MLSHTKLLSAEEKARRFGVACDPSEDRARQEFKNETETAFLLQRYGVPNVVGEFGVVDFDLSLQGVLDAKRAAQEQWRLMTEAEREGYSTWEQLFAAWQSGEYRAPEAPAGGSGGASGAQPSDSAAGGQPEA